MSTSSGMPSASPNPELASWADYSSGGDYDRESPTEQKDPSLMGMTLLKGLGGVQKRVTRDGQPAKRRGPKPDSKPAQTRRQELNRQAQRTHRERKEQYIKALELELSRVREAFATQNTNLRQHEAVLQEHQLENAILKEMLRVRGVPFDHELESRKAVANMQPRRTSGSVGPSPVAPRGPTFQSVTPVPPPSSNYSTTSEHTYGNGNHRGMSSSVSGLTHHNQSGRGGSGSPLIPEHSIKREMDPVPNTMPGVFERDPQLCVEFILALEGTCREHTEYLVRRSVDSADTPEDAQYSGHALMASCLPTSHVTSVPAQMGGLVPTYPHQVPNLPTESLNILLGLNQRLRYDGLLEGMQVTPIMALACLRGHHNYPSLTREDVLGMIEAVRTKLKCQGFGAVMEDFDLRDALSGIFATKPEAYENLPEIAGIDDMYG